MFRRAVAYEDRITTFLLTSIGIYRRSNS
ncbi:unnamed protein product [Acanthoscelides obtectus]|uniref:Uncharacterized protein n=1 Tax=Acanthoscelides obtectus TaxID=200917 RepID=A0A9P0L6M2_ACAOB|nr:unnamed protein product [Acanthoscelides obtectus]CAK1632930.1 hypothetical protein AOBTE_LOCUS7827 [Acanthoscelides obtectus]